MVFSGYHASVKAVFVELPPFERHRSEYFDDNSFSMLQQLLMLNPQAGAVIPGTGGYGSYAMQMNAVGKANVAALELFTTGGL